MRVELQEVGSWHSELANQRVDPAGGGLVGIFSAAVAYAKGATDIVGLLK